MNAKHSHRVAILNGIDWSVEEYPGFKLAFSEQKEVNTRLKKIDKFLNDPRYFN